LHDTVNRFGNDFYQRPTERYADLITVTGKSPRRYQSLNFPVFGARLLA